jgi:hypothetical protein
VSITTFPAGSWAGNMVWVAPFLVEVLLPLLMPPVLRFVDITLCVLPLPVVEEVGAGVMEAEFPVPVCVGAVSFEDAVGSGG